MSYFVLVPDGLNESVYIRVSHISFERFRNASTSSVTKQDQFQLMIQVSALKIFEQFINLSFLFQNSGPFYLP